MINSNVLPLGNAATLTRVVKYEPVKEWWDDFLIKAVECKQQEFNAEIEVQIQALKKQAAAGKKADGSKGAVTLRPRKIGEVKTHYRSIESELQRKELAEETIEDFMKGYFAALQWFFQSDAESLAEKEAEKQRKAEEKAQKALEEAKAVFANIQSQKA